MNESSSLSGIELAQICVMQMELKKYQSVGTVDECKKAVDICKAMIERKLMPEHIKGYMKFEDECVRKGYTFNNILEAMDRTTPQKPIRSGECTCPKCGTYNEVVKKRRNTVAFDTVYCWHCGQAMDVRREQM